MDKRKIINSIVSIMWSSEAGKYMQGAGNNESNAFLGV